ncbi:Aristolochene synthase in complex with 12,13-Difluorofarnesyl diphosphate [Biscogniauxia marginata]|nr:Aristolochene synthase in complex with 12,13-Difluorofarnesyl diphosphate [Biscogniauxia marginata]
MPSTISDLKSTDDLRYPPSCLVVEIHPLEREVSVEVNDYFLQHWPFPDEKARKKFVGSAFPRATCSLFPRALNDRISFACRLLTLLFLIDDLLEDMSIEDGRAYVENLIPICRGDVRPDRSIPVEYMSWDIWESMRAHDLELANAMLEPTFELLRAQTDPVRLEPKGFKEYLKYREIDVGNAILMSLMRFSMNLRISPEDLTILDAAERNCSKHLSVLNDIFSYEKEVFASKTLHAEGGSLCSGVSTLSEAANIPTDAAKHVLYVLCREFERTHEKLSQEILDEVEDTEAVRAYLKGLEFQMSGNEAWTKNTMRYLDPSMEC